MPHRFLIVPALILVSVFAISCRRAQVLETPNKPNVVLIFADDLGTLDLNCYGADDLETPHLDRLAERGVRFSQFYAAAPVCSPSRAALLTGRYPQRAGLASNAWGSRGLPPEQITIAEALKEAGYRTGLFGKWHLGDDPELAPTRQGFDRFFGHKVGCIDNYSHFFYWQGPNKHDLWDQDEPTWADGEYFPSLIVEKSLDFIDETQAESDPFFLYLALNIPHYPLQAFDHWRERYADLPYPRNLYAPVVSSMDEVVGHLLAGFDQRGLTDDTLIIFMSDHGHSVEERTHFGGGYAGPYRGSKFCLFEGGIRVPAIVSFPGRIPQGEVRNSPAIGFDWFPTILDYCGVPEISDHKIDGISIRQVIEQGDDVGESRTLHWETSRNQWAVMQGPWKLLGNPSDPTQEGSVDGVIDGLFLTNIEDDPGESRNQMEANSELTRRLSSLHEEWRAELQP